METPCWSTSVVNTNMAEKAGAHTSGVSVCMLTVLCSNSQRKTHQIAQITHFEPQKRQYTTTEVGLRLF